jgi:hypothetical protein
MSKLNQIYLVIHLETQYYEKLAVQNDRVLTYKGIKKFVDLSQILS